MEQKSVDALPKLALFITALVWGSSFFIMKDISSVFPPSFLTAVRFSIGALALILLNLRRLPELLEKRHLIGALTTGFTQAIGYMLIMLGLALDTSPGKSAFLNAAYCVLVPFMAWLLLRRRPSGWQFAAAVICIIGIGLLSLTDALTVSPGDFVTLIAAVFFALNILAITHAGMQGCDPALLTIGQLGVAALIAWIVTLATGAFPSEPPAPISWAWLALLGLIASGLCMTLQAYGQKHVEPSQASLILSLEAVFGVLFSALFYGEAFTPRMIIGFALIFFAVIASETQLSFLRRPRARKNE